MENFIKEVKRTNNKLILKLIKESTEEIVYDAFRDFYLIAYEAEAIKMDNGEVGANYLFSSIEKARKSFRKLLEHIDLQELKCSEKDIFNVVAENYILAASKEEKDKRICIIENNRKNNMDLLNQAGKLYDFNTITKDILEQIKKDFKL